MSSESKYRITITALDDKWVAHALRFLADEVFPNNYSGGLAFGNGGGPPGYPWKWRIEPVAEEGAEGD